MNVMDHDSRVAILVLKPTREIKVQASHASQAMKPLNSNLPTCATALYFDTVAIEPLSKYLNGSRGLGVVPCSRALTLVLDDLGDVLGALDGALRHAGHAFHEGHVAHDEHVRVPGDRQVGVDLTRPARSISVSDCSASSLPSGLADTPADHTLHADSMRRIVPSESLTVMPFRSTSVTHGVQLDLDAHLLQPRLGLEAQLLAHRRQHGPAPRRAG